MNFLKLAILLLFLNACGGIRILSPAEKEDLYTQSFLEKIEKIKTTYKSGSYEKALSMLTIIEESSLLPAEKSLRKNLIGVIYFSRKEYEKAITHFDSALLVSQQDDALSAQIYLNLASCFYKLGLIEKAFSVMNLANFSNLSPNENSKFHLLKYKLAKELGDDREVITSLIHCLGNKQTITELKNDSLYEVLIGHFIKLENREKYKIIEEFEERQTLIIGYLGYLEAEKRYYGGDKEESEDLLNWLQDKFSNQIEIQSLITSFVDRMQNTAKIEHFSIAVLLPLSGKRKSFGERALKGFDAAFMKEKSRDDDNKIKIHVRDSKGSGIVGSKVIRDLVEKNFVSIIIGGLFPDEAKKEYLEARKNGAFFISLSQIYLPKEQKDHLLVEIPGSIESQINQLFQPEVLNRFGRKVALIYPSSEKGDSIVNEFWRKSQVESVEITDVLAYEEKGNDYRKPVKKLLGLSFPRERQEEYEILDEIYSLEKSRSTRRLQVLKPEIDFDWVFIPSFPLEAIQIIPSFSYYDAFNIPIFGGPSWRSKRLSKESYKFKNLHFIGDDNLNITEDFSNWFKENYNRAPGLIEMLAYDGFKVANDLLSSKQFSNREDFVLYVREQEKLKGNAGVWNLNDGVWIKEMASLSIRNGNITNDFVSGEQSQTLED